MASGSHSIKMMIKDQHLPRPPKEIIRCEIQADLDADDSIRFDFNVIFDRVELLNLGMLSAKKWYIGATGGALQITIYNARLVDFSPPISIDYEHKVSRTVTKTVDFNITPEIALNYGPINGSIGGAGSKRSAEDTVEKQYSFKANEQTLAAIVTQNSAAWDVIAPVVESAIRNYLYGNLYLFANFKSKETPLSGEIKFSPSRILLFNEDGKACSSRISLASLFLIWKNGIPAVSSLYREAKFNFDLEIKN